jgi:hypothetical protein
MAALVSNTIHLKPGAGLYVLAAASSLGALVLHLGTSGRANSPAQLTADSSTASYGQGVFAFTVIVALTIAVAITVLVHQPHTSHPGKSAHRSHESIERAPKALTAAQNLTRARIHELIEELQDDTTSYSLVPGTTTFGDLNGGGENDAVAVLVLLEAAPAISKA